MFGFVLLALVASAAASKVGCPTNVKVVDNFDLKTFGDGVWWEAGRYWNKLEDGANCGYAKYTPSTDGFGIENFDVKNEKLRSIKGSAKLAADAGKTGKLIFSYPYGAGGAITENTLYVLYNDGKTAVLFHCEENEAKTSRQDYAWVFSRSKTIESKTTIDKVLNDSEYVDSSKFIWPDFSEKACKYNA